ncbi:MAG: sigma-54-dependent Fis family transcriptional regulator [Myxococcales bacterium]|jgi:two-component system response regulator HydG|nr:sigma-54-dependent Fis family transcriptional regulator [Myxococcales bacterium]
MREVLQVRLEQWGFPVRTAPTVQRARELVASFCPHVVISDLVLPDATGLALLEALRGEDASRTVLLITAYGTIDTAVQAIKLGAADFLTKPLDYVALRRRLEHIEAALVAAASTRSGDRPGDGAPDDTRHTDTAPHTPEAATLPAGSAHPALDPSATDPSIADGSAGGVGRSEAWRRLQERVLIAARSTAPVLIVGESGSGKELVARTIHERSQRSARPFVPINTAAVPENLVEGEFFGYERGAFTGANQARAGLFEQAHGGTLFLDEVTEMPLQLQPKLLRVLEDGRVRRLGGRAEMSCDVRLVSATNRDPLHAADAGRFRRDLLYRLDVLRIEVPPLRDRKDDIPLLARHFLEECAARYGRAAPSLSSDALERLLAHDWPGNVRELRNVMERVFASEHGATLTAAALDAHWDGPYGGAAATAPQPFGIVIPHGVTAADAERILILETLKATGNNKAETARKLGLDVKTVRNKLKSFESGGADE